MLAAGPQVLLTRAQKADGAQTIASRWLQRLEQLVVGLRPRPAERSGSWTRSSRRSATMPRLAAAMVAVAPGAAPGPARAAPPVEARPRRLSVTEIETWLRDPYAIYARHVLRCGRWSR